MNRLKELDFLRGIAIILVLFRHQQFFSFMYNLGWVGVDLFFVLSGFFVSGLLFKEYLKFGNIDAGRFLIRRGFKIYPIYYLSYLLYLIPIIYKNEFDIVGFFADMTFLQNYMLGWGYAYVASWSLAVEEHFYFVLTILIWIGLKYKIITLSKVQKSISPLINFEIIILSAMALCLILRIWTNLLHPLQFSKNFTMTHLRMDSLLSGVFISYLYYFKNNHLKKIFEAHTSFFLVLAFIGISWTPFLQPEHSFFVMTVGFLFLYLSFGILLVWFLFTANINQTLNRTFSVLIVNLVSKIGFCSYSIYLIHTLVNTIENEMVLRYHLFVSHFLSFVLTSTISVFAGMLMTYSIERYFLKIRDRYYPSRAVYNSFEIL